MELLVGISNHHIHLTKESYIKLFGNSDLEVRNMLVQTGEFASNRVVRIRNHDRVIENVRILGPFRNYDQVEISKTESIYLKVNAPMRDSGDILNSGSITIEGPAGVINLKEGLIIPTRHVHMNEDFAKLNGFHNTQKLLIKIDSIKSGTIEAYIKTSPNGVLELHLDTDDGNAFMLTTGEKVELIEKF